MTDVVHSVNLDQQRLDPFQQPYYSNIPATNTNTATNAPSQLLPASICGLDLLSTGEQTVQSTPLINSINDYWSNLIAMTFQQFQLELDPELSSTNSSPQQQQQQQQHSRYNDMTAVFPTQYSSAQQTYSSSSLEPSGSYPSISTTSVSFNNYPSSTIPQTGSIDVGNYSTINSRNITYSQQQQQQHHHHQQQHQQQHQHQQHHNRIEMSSNPQLIQNCYNFQPNQTNQLQNYQATTNSRPTLFIPPTYNNISVPLFDSNPTIFTAKPHTNQTISITQPTSNSSSTENTSPTKQTTFNYGGPPKSYYSRLPLYDRPFKCDQCPQSFNRNHDLKRHKRIHLAVKPYPCPYCEKQFSRKDALKRHILVKNCNNKTATKGKNESKIENESPIKTEPTSDNSYATT